MKIKYPSLLFIALSLGPFMAGIDFLAVGVAIDSIIQSLSVHIATVQWFLTGYAIGNCSFQVTANVCADHYGQKRVLNIGIVAFALSSLIIALSHSSFVIILARIVQGASAGVFPTVGLSIMMSSFTHLERAKWSAGRVGAVGLGMVLGPTLGGYLTHYFGWRYIFLINVPICLINLGLTALFVPKLPYRAHPDEKIDWLGMLFLVATLVTFTMGISQGHSWGWANIKTLSAFASTLICGVLFIFWESKSLNPLLDLKLFKIPNFTIATLATTFCYFFITGWILIFGIYLQRAMNLSANAVGLLFLPFGIAATILPIAMKKLTHLFGNKKLLICGLALSGIAFAGLATLHTLPSHLSLVFWFFVLGLGYAMINSSSVPTAVANVEERKIGLATSKLSVIRWLGSAFGASTLTALFTTQSKKALLRATADSPEMQQQLLDVISGVRSSSILQQNIISHSYHRGLVVSMIVLALLSLFMLILIQLGIKEKKA